MNIQLMTFSFCGGLAIFLFGIGFMSDGLKNIGSNTFRQILKTLTKNRISAIMVGAGITCLVDKEVAHKGINDLRIVNSMHERKALMESLSDAFIAMPGGFGTIEEIFEAITWAQLGLHIKPCGFLNINGFFDKLFDFISTVSSEGFIKKEYLNLMQIDTCPEELLKKLLLLSTGKNRQSQMCP